MNTRDLDFQQNNYDERNPKGIIGFTCVLHRFRGT